VEIGDQWRHFAKEEDLLDESFPVPPHKIAPGLQCEVCGATSSPDLFSFRPCECALEIGHDPPLKRPRSPPTEKKFGVAKADVSAAYLSCPVDSPHHHHLLLAAAEDLDASGNPITDGRDVKIRKGEIYSYNCKWMPFGSVLAVSSRRPGRTLRRCPGCQFWNSGRRVPSRMPSSCEKLRRHPNRLRSN